jgi:xylulose-5-phosphate/fructose-6-phosphate phosphoketolase
VIHELLYGRPNPDRFHVHGYVGQDGAITLFHMRMLNRMSRFDLAIAAIQQVRRLRDTGNLAIEKLRQHLARHEQYIREHGKDMPDIADWRWDGFIRPAGFP